MNRLLMTEMVSFSQRHLKLLGGVWFIELHKCFTTLLSYSHDCFYYNWHIKFSYYDSNGNMSKISGHKMQGDIVGQALRQNAPIVHFKELSHRADSCLTDTSLVFEPGLAGVVVKWAPYYFSGGSCSIQEGQ